MNRMNLPRVPARSLEASRLRLESSGLCERWSRRPGRPRRPDVTRESPREESSTERAPGSLAECPAPARVYEEATEAEDQRQPQAHTCLDMGPVPPARVKPSHSPGEGTLLSRVFLQW